MAADSGVNGDGIGVPPSTLAAQLAESHAHPGRAQQPGDEEALNQLLAEIRSSPESLGSDVESNHALITVISNAALKARPDADPHTTSPRQLAGLRAIEVSFRRNPGVLFHVAQAPGFDDEQLCLQLLPRLFNIATATDEEPVKDAVRRLLSIFLSHFRGSLQHHGRFVALLELLLGSAEGQLNRPPAGK